MHFIRIVAISILMYSFTVAYTIISIDTPDGNSIDTDTLMGYFGSDMDETRIAVTRHEDDIDMVGKSHRFYFMSGERVQGDKLLENRFKNTGGQTKNPREVNVTFVSKDNKLTYVMMIVYQESDKNQMHVFDGGINQGNIGISIKADATRYIAYNVSFYGK